MVTQWVRTAGASPMAAAGLVAYRQRPGKRCERDGWPSSWRIVPRVCTPHADRQGGEPRPTGPTAGQATPGRTAGREQDRRALELTHGVNATATDGSARMSVSSDAVHDAGAPDRHGQAAGCRSPDASRWHAGGGWGHGRGIRGQPRGQAGRRARVATPWAVRCAARQARLWAQGRRPSATDGEARVRGQGGAAGGGDAAGAIDEPDFHEGSYGFREGRSPLQALHVWRERGM
jgi:hypothetical protein